MNEEEQQPQGAPPVEEPSVQTAPQAGRSPAATPPTQPNPVQTAEMIEPQEGIRNEYQQTEPQRQDATYWEKLKKGFEAAGLNKVVNTFSISDESNGGSPGFLERALQEYKANNEGQKLKGTELNKMLPGMSIPFSDDETYASAKIKWDHDQHLKNLQDFASKHGDLDWLSKIGVGLATNIADPANWLIFGGGPAAEAGLGAVVASNAAIMTSIEAASALQAKHENQPTSWGDALTNIVVGTATGVGLHYSMGALFRHLKDADKKIKGIPPDINQDNLRQNLAESESNGKMTATPGEAIAKARAAGEMAGEKSPYRFSPMEHPSDRAMFGAASKEGLASDLGGDDLGPGRRLSDDGIQANNFATDGQVGEYHIAEDKKFLNLEDASRKESGEAHDFIKALEEKTGLPLTTEVDQDKSIGDSMKELIERAGEGNIPEDMAQKIQDVAKEQGYDGYQGVQETSNGKKNFIHLFDDGAKPAIVHAGNSDLVPKQDPTAVAQVIKDAQKPDGKFFNTEELEKEYRDLRHEKPQDTNEEGMNPIQAEKYKSDFAKLQEMAKEDPALKDAIDDLREQDTTDAQEKDLFKRMATCVLGSMG